MTESVSQIEVTLKSAAEVGGSAMPDIVGHLVWPVLFLVLLLVLRSELRGLLRAFSNRVRSGAAIKMGDFEVGAVNISHINLADPKADARKDNGERENERNSYYEACRNLMLVHRLACSRTDGQEFDVLVYLVPHGNKGTLACVQKVEYFLGKFWQSAIYTSSNRYSGFPIRLSAYGPALCSAKLYFTDGTSTIIHRYLDFEMGASAPLLSETGARRGMYPVATF